MWPHRGRRDQLIRRPGFSPQLRSSMEARSSVSCRSGGLLPCRRPSIACSMTSRPRHRSWSAMFAWTAELRLRLDELRASRQRLATAQDDERRRIERNLHDGAQQQLIAIAGRLGLAEGRQLDPQTARLFAELKVEVASALDDLRGIGRGLYPPLLASHGLRPALAALARRAPLPVSLHVSAERFDRTLEGAVYFCVSEALQNACRHSGATSVDIGVVSTGDRVSFSVQDNGCGIMERGGAAPGALSGGGLQNMADRMAAVGGGLNVASSDSGTQVSGWCPEQISESVKGADDERT